MEYEGMNRLARVLQARMGKVSDKPCVFDLGTIGADMSLKTDKFDIPIPKKDYLVCKSLMIGEKDDVLVKTTEQQNHTHNVTVPQSLEKLKKGDRVLVAWLGNDAVIIDIVMNL